ncbi:MAG: AsmA family protein, partial [Roseburia sp.]|nr:AsmA family protein [Roseburia sp.]
MAEKVKCALWKSVLKWVWWTLFSVFVLLIIGITVAINFVFTSEKLTPLVEKAANEYLNADVRIGEMELTFFSTFPDFGVKVSDARVVSGVFRDTTGGAGVASDSLMCVEKVLITVDPLAYLKKKKIKVKDFILDNPRIYAFINADGEANWNVYDMASDTTVADSGTVEEESEALLLDIKNVRIRGGYLVFDDRSTDLYFRLEDLNAGVDGNFLGRTADLQLNLNARNILFWQEGKLLVKKLAFGVETGMSIDRDSFLYRLDKAVFEVNGMKFGAGGTVKADTLQRLLDVDVKYGIHIPSLKTLIDLIPEAVLQKDKEADIRGDVLCTGDIRGQYGKKNVPLITAFFRIKDGYVAYEGMPSRIEELNTDFEAVVDLQKQQPSEVKLNHFCLKGGETDVDAKGVVENLLGDPVIKAEVKAKVDFDDITRIFPLTD